MKGENTMASRWGAWKTYQEQGSKGISIFFYYFVPLQMHGKNNFKHLYKMCRKIFMKILKAICE
jgi:hypothetical protein